ncbi:hypothetical protein IJ579_01230 [bacterium]|nr:hypothetical protein [bacterium]
MNKFTLKNIAVVSLIIGFIFGILAAIPFVGIFSLCSVMLLVAPLTIIYLIMDGKLDLTTPKDSIIHGAAAGFCANLTFSGTFSVIIAVMAAFGYIQNLFLSAVIVNSPIWLLFINIIFVGFLVAATNSFSGFLTYYLIDFVRDMYERKSGNGRI